MDGLLLTDVAYDVSQGVEVSGRVSSQLVVLVHHSSLRAAFIYVNVICDAGELLVNRNAVIVNADAKRCNIVLLWRTSRTM